MFSVFIGSVSLAGATSGLWAVHGGNKQIPKQLLRLSKATLHRAQVTKVTLTKSGKFVLEFFPVAESSQDQEYKEYDTVIFATPLTEDKSKIVFKNFSMPLKFPGRFHRTVCTIVFGSLNYTHFRFHDENDALNEILTIKDVFFNSVGMILPVDYDGTKKSYSDMWKVFSQAPLSSQELDMLFSKRSYVNVIDWLAYPQYTLNHEMGSFVLAKNVFYVNAIEWAASAMEMSVIGAKNVALLAYKSWFDRENEYTVDSVDANRLHEEL